ncbi:MAG: hypothetical protein QHJ73_14135, partial [Armatimonadota bacterium]|nr:hypothetical protein [Armatimonadota bacterium]
MMNRRTLLKAMGASTAAGAWAVATRDAPAAQKRPGRVPFRVLFSNDATNILTCTSPYHQKRAPFRPEMLLASVDETAGTGVEVHLLQPCSTWVPWWQSKVYPIAEHHAWWRQRFGVEIRNSVHDYLLQGGDLLKDFIGRCRQKGLSPFVSLRLNDGHHLEHVTKSAADRNQAGNHTLCRFYDEHPEYRIGPDLNNWDQRVHNWAIPEARAYKMALIREVCQNYDMDGLELDFMRHPSYFQLDKTTVEERRRVMTQFVAEVRAALDTAAPPGRRRYLGVRVPGYLAEHDRLGLHLPALVEAGVEMVTLSAFYYTVFNMDLALIRALVPDAALYVEVTHCTVQGKRITGVGYDDFTFRRTTPQQFYTAAHQGYARGCDGVSAFNFVYYREHGTEGRGPFNEPPFEVFRHLGDPAWLARQPQHYLYARGWRVSSLPRRLKAGETATL